MSDLLLAGYRARFTVGYGAAAQPLRQALEKLRVDNVDPDVGMRWFGLGAIAAGSLWDDEAMIDISEHWVRTARRLGAVTYLPLALAFRAFTDWLTGHLDEAADRFVEMRELMPRATAPTCSAARSAASACCTPTAARSLPRAPAGKSLSDSRWPGARAASPTLAGQFS